MSVKREPPTSSRFAAAGGERELVQESETAAGVPLEKTKQENERNAVIFNFFFF